MHAHKYAYGDVPGLGECKCGAYRVWDRQSHIHKEYERECELYECYEGAIKGSKHCQYHQRVKVSAI